MKFKDLDMTKAFRRTDWLSSYPSWIHERGLNFPIDSDQHVYMGYTDIISDDWINTEEGQDHESRQSRT